MPTELEELVEFLHHGNTQIRQIAAENLVPYSQSQPSLFKRNQLEPIKDLKLLVKDYTPIKQNALTMLVNLSGDKDILASLATDDTFLESLLLRITNQEEPHANLISMLLANLSKSDSLTQLFTLKRSIPPNLGGSPLAIDQLMDLFVRGAAGSWNPAADYDYLAYLFADLAKHKEGSTYLTNPQPYDRIYPLAKLLPFTAVDKSLPRRLGVASAVKNVAFELGKHEELLGEELRLLSYVLVPLADGRDKYSDEEEEEMMDELQMMDEGVRRERDSRVVKAHLETMLILSTGQAGREALRKAGVYYVIRELHSAVEDTEVQEAVDRLVQVLQRGEPGEANGDAGETSKLLKANCEEDDDDKIVQVL